MIVLLRHFFWPETLTVQWTEKVLELLPLPVFVNGGCWSGWSYSRSVYRVRKEWCRMWYEALLCSKGNTGENRLPRWDWGGSSCGCGAWMVSQKPWSKRTSTRRDANSQEVTSNIGGGNGDKVMGAWEEWPEGLIVGARKYCQCV